MEIIDDVLILVRRDTLAGFIADGYVPQNGEPIAIIDPSSAMASSYLIGNGKQTVDKLPALSKGDKGDPAPLDGVPQFHGVQQTSYGHSFGQVQNPPNVWPMSVYPARLRDALNTDPSLYQNRTVSGSNMVQIAAHAADTWVDGTGGLVTLMGNQNSVGQGQSEDTFKTALRSFVTTIRGTTGVPPLLLILKDTTCLQAGYNRYNPPPTDDDVARFNQYVDDVVTEFDYDWIVVADPQGAGWDPTIMTCPDGQHPNDVGMAHIAATALDVLRRVPWRPGLNVGVSVVTQTAPTPLTLNATPGNGSVTITRTGGAGAGVSYAIYRGSTPTGDPVATSFPFTDSGLANGTPVSYVATAKNLYGAVTSPVVTATPAAPAIYVADNFDRADSTTSLGSTSTGDVPWTAGGVNGSANSPGIQSKQAYPTTYLDVTAIVEVGHADAFVQVRLVTAGDAGLVLRAASNTTFDMLYAPASGPYQLARCVNGTYTVQPLGTAVTPGNGDVLAARMVGGNVALFVNGVLLHTYTDTTNVTNTKFGIRFGNLGARFDDFLTTAP